MHRFIDNVDGLLRSLPSPMFEPVWFPGVPHNGPDIDRLIERLQKLVLELIELLVRFFRSEGFFDENPLIRIYPDYPNATGIVIFYKGEKVWEKWIMHFELSWNESKEEETERPDWHGRVYASPYTGERYTMDPELDPYYDPFWRMR